MAWGLALLSLTAALVLGGDFGVASASGEPAVGNRVLVDLEVEIFVSADVVVAHLIQPGGEQETISMSGDSSGIFRGAATIPKADLVVVFEAVRGPGNSVLSSPATLTELGLDRALLGDLVAPIEEAPVAEPTAGIGGPLLIAILSGVLSLALIAWWAWSGGVSPDRRQLSPGESDELPAEALLVVDQGEGSSSGPDGEESTAATDD